MKAKAEQLLQQLDQYVQFYHPWENVGLKIFYGGPSREEMQLDKILQAFREVAEAQREHDLNEIEDERGNLELSTCIKAIKWNIRKSSLVTDNPTDHE